MNHWRCLKQVYWIEWKWAMAAQLFPKEVICRSKERGSFRRLFLVKSSCQCAKQSPGGSICCSTETCDLSEMGENQWDYNWNFSIALLKLYTLPSLLQVLVEELLSGTHTRARNGDTQAAFLLFTYFFQLWVGDYCISQAPPRKQKAPSAGNRIMSLGRAVGMEEGLPRLKPLPEPWVGRGAGE